LIVAAAGSVRLPDLFLLRIVQPRREELALIHLDPSGVGEVAHEHVDPAVALLDPHLVRVRLFPVHKLRGEVLELLAGARDAVDQLQVDESHGHGASPRRFVRGRVIAGGPGDARKAAGATRAA
jgi:hypothetical protein